MDEVASACATQWGEDDARAYLGITLPEYPNFFMIYGPNTNLAHGGSAIFHSECQIRYAMEGIRELIETGARSIECRRAPYEAYNAKVDAALKRMVWSHRAMTNWYKNKRGRVVHELALAARRLPQHDRASRSGRLRAGAVKFGQHSNRCRPREGEDPYAVTLVMRKAQMAFSEKCQLARRVWVPAHSRSKNGVASLAYGGDDVGVEDGV